MSEKTFNRIITWSSDALIYLVTVAHTKKPTYRYEEANLIISHIPRSYLHRGGDCLTKLKKMIPFRFMMDFFDTRKLVGLDSAISPSDSLHLMCFRVR